MTEEKPVTASGRPPVLAERLLGVFTSLRLRDSLIGDFAEVFANDSAIYGERRAKLRYWANVLAALGPLAWRWLERFFPLIWAALWRKPVRTVLTLLSVTAAFVLFGLSMGIGERYLHSIDAARADRIYVDARFSAPLTQSMMGQIARLPGVTAVGFIDDVFGPYKGTKTVVDVTMMDDSMRQAWPDMPLDNAQYAELKARPDGVIVSRMYADKLHLKRGDTLIVQSADASRRDGSSFWRFDVLEIVDDPVLFDQVGFIFGNYSYLDQARLVEDRGQVGQAWVLVKDAARAHDTAYSIEAMFANSPAPVRTQVEKDSYDSLAVAGLDIFFITKAVAGAGIFMILFLTANTIAQSVRERIPEFAVLKTLGFSDWELMALVFAEASLPCLLGAALGLSLATGVAAILPHVKSLNGDMIPFMAPSLYLLSGLFALLVASLSAVVPVTRLMRLDVAAALAKRS